MFEQVLSNFTKQETPREIVISQDAAWSKRGRAMNSLSGKS